MITTSNAAASVIARALAEAQGEAVDLILVGGTVVTGVVQVERGSGGPDVPAYPRAFHVVDAGRKVVVPAAHVLAVRTAA